jgi:hypothetical protein
MCRVNFRGGKVYIKVDGREVEACPQGEIAMNDGTAEIPLVGGGRVRVDLGEAMHIAGLLKLPVVSRRWSR